MNPQCCVMDYVMYNMWSVEDDWSTCSANSRINVFTRSKSMVDCFMGLAHAGDSIPIWFSYVWEKKHWQLQGIHPDIFETVPYPSIINQWRDVWPVRWNNYVTFSIPSRQRGLYHMCIDVRQSVKGSPRSQCPSVRTKRNGRISLA